MYLRTVHKCFMERFFLLTMFVSLYGTAPWTDTRVMSNQVSLEGFVLNIITPYSDTAHCSVIRPEPKREPPVNIADKLI